MDGTANLAVVTGIPLTKERLDFRKVRDGYQRRLAGFDRFRQRVVERGFPIPAPQWADMPNSDIDQHVHRVAVPAPRDRAALTAFLNDIASSPLDREQPLWQALAEPPRTFLLFFGGCYLAERAGFEPAEGY